ncbi:MAG: hypothetical protein IIV43_03985, partial [Oscillospiraceae bacterium]|nr:hypothetical protein [Oscillospiraceae bacterium]
QENPVARKGRTGSIPVRSTIPLDFAEGDFFVAQRKIPVVLYPVHHNPRFHGEVNFVTVYPRNAVFSWTGAAQSMLREPFGEARSACFEQLAGAFASCGASL